jgi:HD superfamily phosphodiesterase
MESSGLNRRSIPALKYRFGFRFQVINLIKLEKSVSNNNYRDFIQQECETDSSHDTAHVMRVVAAAVKLADEEGADRQVVEAAAWLHDCVVLPKNHPQRSKSSSLASVKAEKFLKMSEFPNEKIQAVVHAIQAHSYSAGIAPQTVEAKLYKTPTAWMHWVPLA